jgi:hypothetical protein
VYETTDAGASWTARDLPVDAPVDTLIANRV